MAQAPIGYDLKNPNTNALTPGSLDAQATSQLFAQGLKSALNLSAAAVIKTGPGRLVRIVSSTATAITVNDAATTGAATTATIIFTGTITAGSVILLDFPVSAGLVVSAITGVAAISYT
jgi:hypothetical protein